MFPEKLKSRWTGPYTVKEEYLYGAVSFENIEGLTFKVNGHRLKLYISGPVDRDVEVLELHHPHA